MEFKRHHNHNHHQHPGFGFNSRPNNPGNGPHSGYQQNAFVNHHPHPPPHNSRPFKPNDGHNHNHNHNNGGRLSLTHSFRNLLKMQNEMVVERGNGFQKLAQLRDLMLTRITTITNSLLREEFLDGFIDEVKGLVEEQEKEGTVKNQDTGEGGETEEGAANEGTKRGVKGHSGITEEVKNCLRHQINQILHDIKEETKIYTMREDNFLGTVFSKERRVEKDFLEFFNEAERQIIDYEKKIRSDQYSQMITRLRNADREMALRDQKIMQLEDALKIVGDRSEKYMAELQQVSADHQFEKLKLYHHVELCKYNAKSMAVEEVFKLCKWKQCQCGRDFDEVLREAETYKAVLNGLGMLPSQSQEGFPVGRCKEMPERREMTCSLPWVLPTVQSQMPPNQPIPTGSYIPSEEAATKGTVLNDLRDRYDEIQMKAAAIPNYEEVRAMIMKIVCHFKTGGLRVCEEIRGKQFVSSLFYCKCEDLAPSITDNIFSTGYGSTPEEATQLSVQRAFDEIQRMENMNVENKGMDMTFVRRNPTDSVLGKLEKEAIRMTLLRSYCNEKVDEESSDDVRCLQEAHLYQNHANAEEKYMADWKIHIRVEDTQESGIQDKLKHILRTIKDNHVYDFINRRPQKGTRE